MDTREAVLTALASAPAIAASLIREMPAEYRQRRPQPGKWSAHEHIVHLAAVHPVFFKRLDLLLTQDNPAIVPYHPDKAEDPEAMLQLDLEDAITRFTTDRAKLVAHLRALPASAWERRARHPEFRDYSVLIMMRHLAVHDGLHLFRVEQCWLMS